MASLYAIWLRTTKNEEHKFYGSMVDKSTKMASIANKQLIYLFWTKLAIYYITIANHIG
jgi:hypothetical protein